MPLYGGATGIAPSASSRVITKVSAHPMTHPDRSRIAMLHRVSKIVSSGLTLNEMLQALADIAFQVTGCDACLVYLLDQATGEIVLRASQLPHDQEIGQVRLRMGEGVTGWVALHTSVVALSENASADPRFKAFLALPEDTYEAFLSAPLVTGGEVVGVINVHHRAKHVHSVEEKALLLFLGEQMSGAIVKSRFAEFSKSAVKRMGTLAAITRAISAESYLDRILRVISEMVAESLDSPACSITMMDKIEDSVMARVAQERRLMIVPNVPAADSRNGQRSSQLSVPLFVRGSVLGVINIHTREQRAFTSDEVDFVKVVAAQAATAIENSRLLAMTLELKRTLETRQIIERAKAILQAKFRFTEEQAYLRLRDESRRRRRPMRDLAEAVIMADDLQAAKE